MKLLGNRGAAGHRATLEDQRFQTLLREIKCRHERIVPGAKDHDFTRCRHV
jgi:hypothetical protein